ncbi:MAG: ABC transporter permease subunit [Anaerolineae bacterium]|nr:ABC transporter permease subunit [Anaerolineae bacterium]
MHIRAVRAVAIRDLKIVLRSKGVMLPIVLLPVILMILLPAGIGIAAPWMVAEADSELDDLAMFFDAMPGYMQITFAGYSPVQTMVVVMLVYFFAPLFLVMPLMVASTIAANSFAGEKERKTLEALIYTPTTDAELFIGKMLAAWIPAFLVAVGSFVLYGITANLAAWPTMGRIFFPNAMWIVLVFWVAPAAAGLGLGSMILVSSKVNTFQEAYQIGGVVVLPVIMLMFGQISGVLYLSVGVVVLVGLVLWLVDAALLWFAVRTFKRDEIIARL